MQDESSSCLDKTLGMLRGYRKWKICITGADHGSCSFEKPLGIPQEVEHMICEGKDGVG